MRLNWSAIYLSLWPCVEATCECGFRVRDGQPQDLSTFMYALETNFVAMKSIDADKDWTRQEFNVTAQAGRGLYGKTFTPDNVVAIYGKGLQLHVDSQLKSNSVLAAEVDTSRFDLLWGSYRAGVRLTAIPGTCAAFFWYFNDTQEIDMEFLSHEFNHLNKTFPVNLVIQSRESDRAGFDAHGTNTFQTVNLDFDPTAAFHEYRFDYLPGKVKFYADSKLLCEMTGSAIPSSTGHLILQHWSNGNALWSGGPPAEDASITVSYVKAYYNSSKTSTDLFVECDGSMDRTCLVPDMSALNASTGGPYLTLGEPYIGDASAANILISAGVAQYLVIIWLITLLRVAYE